MPKFPEFHAFSKIAPGIEHLAFSTRENVNTRTSTSLGQEISHWESDRGTRPPKTGGWQQPLSQSSCLASCHASCETNKSWTAGSKCLKTGKYSRQHGKKKKCWHPLNGPYQILGQEASMLPDQHLPAMCMGASHAPSTSWRMCEVVYNNCLFFTGRYRTLLARDAKQPNHWKEKIDTFWPHVAPTSKYKWLV